MSTDSNVWVTGWPGPPTPPLTREHESLSFRSTGSWALLPALLLSSYSGNGQVWGSSASRACAMKALTPQHPWVIARICKASVGENPWGWLASKPR